MTNKQELEDLTIVVSRYWPLRKLKDIKINIEGEDAWRNEITLNERQATLLYKALTEELYADTRVELPPTPRSERADKKEPTK